MRKGLAIAALLATFGGLFVTSSAQASVKGCQSGPDDVETCSYTWVSGDKTNTVTVYRNVMKHLVWGEITNNNEVWLDYSTDGGATWTGPLSKGHGKTPNTEDIYAGYSWRACGNGNGVIRCSDWL